MEMIGFDQGRSVLGFTPDLSMWTNSAAWVKNGRWYTVLIEEHDGIWRVHPQPRETVFLGKDGRQFTGIDQLDVNIQRARLTSAPLKPFGDALTPQVGDWRFGYLRSDIYLTLKAMVFDPEAFHAACARAERIRVRNLSEAEYFGRYMDVKKYQGLFLLYPDSKCLNNRGPGNKAYQAKPLKYQAPSHHFFNFVLEKVIPKWQS